MSPMYEIRMYMCDICKYSQKMVGKEKNTKFDHCPQCGAVEKPNNEQSESEIQLILDVLSKPAI